MTTKVTADNVLLFIFLFCTYLVPNNATTGEEHRTFQYNKPIDETGAYNFAYDTGSKDAHSMRMENRDDHGIVRGRYGYTDPHGKLRMVEYEAGPQGFRARGDVGPDKSLHAVAPESPASPKLTNLQMMGWDPEKDPISIEMLPMEHRSELEPVVAIPISDDHPVKGYQAPIPVQMKSKRIIAAAITEDHPIKGYQAPVPIMQKHIDPDVDVLVKDIHPPQKTIDIMEPVVEKSIKRYPAHPVPIKMPPKSVVAPVRLDHPVKGHTDVVAHLEAPPKSIAVPAAVRLDHPVKGHTAPIAHLEAPPKSIAVPAAVRLDHPEKGYTAPVAHLEAPPKTISVPEPVRIDHYDKGDYHSKPIRHLPQVVPVAKTYSDKHLVPPPANYKSMPISAPLVYDHTEKGYVSGKHVVQKSSDIELDHHVEKPKSIALMEPVDRHIHEPPEKSVAFIRSDHPVKGYVAPQPIVQKTSRVMTDYHVDEHPKSFVRVAPVRDNFVKGYQGPQRIVDKSSHIEKSTHHHQHLENVYGPWTSPGHVDYNPKSPKSLSIKEAYPHYHNGDEYRSSHLRVYPVSSGKQRHYHTEEKPHSIHSSPMVVADDKHHHHDHGRTVKTKHDHEEYQAVKVPTAKYHKHDQENMAIVDRHTEVTTTDKHGKILDHYHQRLEPLTIRNIDVDPNEIRTVARPTPHHHHSSSDVDTVRVAANVPVDTQDVRIRGRQVPRSASSGRVIREPSYVVHGSGPRRVSYVPGNRYRPGSFVFQ